uniref:Acetyltransferase n=1 Tax=viral metagenome TaxID=1070528 RepID=A0A6H1ZSG6_9ZZZZ
MEKVKIRIAEIKDIPAIFDMFMKLTDYLKEQGQWLYAQDQNQFVGGLLHYIDMKLHMEGNVILVSEDETGYVNGFLAGEIRHYAPFFEHRIVGELQWLWPLSVSAQHLVEAFARWSREKGATAESNYCTPGNIPAQKAIERDGRKLGFLLYYKPYPKGGKP